MNNQGHYSKKAEWPQIGHWDKLSQKNLATLRKQTESVLPAARCKLQPAWRIKVFNKVKVRPPQYDTLSERGGEATIATNEVLMSVASKSLPSHVSVTLYLTEVNPVHVTWSAVIITVYKGVIVLLVVATIPYAVLHVQRLHLYSTTE